VRSAWERKVIERGMEGPKVGEAYQVSFIPSCRPKPKKRIRRRRRRRNRNDTISPEKESKVAIRDNIKKT